MKRILEYFKSYKREEFSIWYFIAVMLFVALSLGFNYTFDFERRVVLSASSRLFLFIFYIIFFGFPYVVTVTLYIMFFKKNRFLREKGFYVLSCIIVAGLALEASTDIGGATAGIFVPVRYAPLFALCMNNIIQALLWFTPPFLYWLFQDRGTIGLYGIRKKGFSLYPYFIMLAVLAPFVFWSSRYPDFLQAYPRYRLAAIAMTDENVPYLLLFEFCYGLAFVSVEFYFRGFMIMALRRYLGSGAVLPAAAVYSYIHFQKPFLEALSSFFGGLGLGVISNYGGSIFGGVIVHLGTAWMMECAAILQM